MKYLPQETIRRKRDGEALDAGELRRFVAGVASGEIGEAQIAAFAMAVFLRGMNPSETAALTLAMRDSGRVLSWPDLGGPVLDKHSTGGVGDKVSLVLAPLLAACGAYVPMISGRGLGHTGGTLDKLESIPGYDVRPDPEQLRRSVREVGCAIVGQTADLAPADGLLYAVRDVTATVESIPLITASILSKKLAAGLDALVMDVKTGSGAFMATAARARCLARSIVEVARLAGTRCTALLTDMNQVLGRTAGNAVEVAEAIAMLRGEPADPRLHEVTLALAQEALILGGIERDPPQARSRAERALRSGDAAERFARMIAALGGPADLVERPQRHLPVAPVVRPAPAPLAGHVETIDVRALGLAIVALGGGRSRSDETVDHRVGLTDCAGIGVRLEAGDPLVLVHAANEDSAASAIGAVQAAFRLSDGPVAPGPMVLERLAAET